MFGQANQREEIVFPFCSFRVFVFVESQREEKRQEEVFCWLFRLCSCACSWASRRIRKFFYTTPHQCACLLSTQCCTVSLRSAGLATVGPTRQLNWMTSWQQEGILRNVVYCLKMVVEKYTYFSQKYCFLELFVCHISPLQTHVKRSTHPIRPTMQSQITWASIHHCQAVLHERSHPTALGKNLKLPTFNTAGTINVPDSNNALHNPPLVHLHILLNNDNERCLCIYAAVTVEQMLGGQQSAYT